MSIRSALGATSFGVMQGRLSPQDARGYQVFPWGTWVQEFHLARRRQLDHIEWVLDSHRLMDNPLLTEPSAVASLAKATGVKVVSVCADFLMDTPLGLGHEGPNGPLASLLESMELIGASHLVMPFVDQSSLRTAVPPEGLIRAAAGLAEDLRRRNISVWLETDLGPEDFAALLSELEPDVFGVNYDIGNSASLGFDVSEEWTAYGSRIGLIHIKDRTFGGVSTPLGTGHADFPSVFAAMQVHGFEGVVTMQAFRDQQGVQVLDSQLHWLERELSGSRS